MDEATIERPGGTCAIQYVLLFSDTMQIEALSLNEVFL